MLKHWAYLEDPSGIQPPCHGPASGWPGGHAEAQAGDEPRELALVAARRPGNRGCELEDQAAATAQAAGHLGDQVDRSEPDRHGLEDAAAPALADDRLGGAAPWAEECLRLEFEAELH